VIVRPAGVTDEALQRVFRVPPELAGMRLDVFLMLQLRNTSRTRARRIIESCGYTPDGRHLKANDRVRGEDRVVLWRPPFEPPPEGVPPLHLLYEDEHVLVVDKPPLVAVHPTARYHQNTVIKRLEAERPDEFFSLIHRLDRETSGILLVAKTPEADRSFKRVLEDRSMAVAAENLAPEELTKGMAAAARRGRALQGRVQKTYLALTWGIPENGLIDLPLEVDPENSLRVKMRIAAPGRGMEARTTICVRDTRNGYALVECDLHTGRQHQIRIHLASRGCPVVGDKLYGPDERLLARAADNELTDADRERLELPRHALHAHRYRLPHPLTGAELDLVSPLAPDLIDFWSSLDHLA
jgi:23S rRNA pseudouridine1911/1915/1917 synthase